MDFDRERELEDAGLDAFDLYMMDEEERREALDDAGLDPDDFDGIEYDPEFDAWQDLQNSGLSLWELDLMDEEEKRTALEDAGLDPDDFDEFPLPVFSSPPKPPKAPAPQTRAPIEPPGPSPSAEPVRKVKTHPYVQVQIPNAKRLFSYRIDGRVSGIKAGDRVIVPVGPGNQPTEARVILVGECTEADAPYPPEKMKWVTRITPAKASEPAETGPAAPPVSAPLPPVTYRYAQLRFPDSDQISFCRVSDDIQVGDPVIVPSETPTESRTAQVISIGDYTAQVAPCPPETANWARKRKENPPPVENARTDRKTTPPQSSTDNSSPRRRRILWIAAGLLIAAVLAVVLLLSAQKPVPAEEPETKDPASSSAAVTPAEDPAPIRMDDARSKEEILRVMTGTEACLDDLMAFNSEMWESGPVSVSIDKIREYETAWSGRYDEMVKLLAEMALSEPSAYFRSSWEGLREYVEILAETARILSNWDRDGDGKYTGEECTAVNNEARKTALRSLDALDRISGKASESGTEADSGQSGAAGTPSAPKQISLPQPSVSHLSGSSSSKGSGTMPSDPYNARDYYHAEDFYDDHYDDFFDYEEAEDYWNEWND